MPRCRTLALPRRSLTPPQCFLTPPCLPLLTLDRPLTHSRRHSQYIHVSVDGTFF